MSPHWRRLLDALCRFLRRSEPQTGAGALGWKRSWRDTIRVDTVLGPFHGERARHGLNTGFGGRRVDSTRTGAGGVGGQDAEDAAVILPLHVRVCGSAAEKAAVTYDVHH